MRALLLFGALLVSAPAFAQDAPGVTVTEAEADHRVSALAEELKSPFCPGKTLLTCTSAQAYTLRKEMHAMVLRGLTDPEVIAELQERYGDEVSNPPQPWYTFFVPLLPYLLGAVLVFLVIRTWLRRGKGDDDDVGLSATPEDQERLARLRARVAAMDDD